MNKLITAATLALAISQPLTAAAAGFPAKFDWVHAWSSQNGTQYYSDTLHLRRQGNLIGFWTAITPANVFINFSANCKSGKFVNVAWVDHGRMINWPSNGRLEPAPEAGSPLAFMISNICIATTPPAPDARPAVPTHETTVQYLDM